LSERQVNPSVDDIDRVITHLLLPTDHPPISEVVRLPVELAPGVARSLRILAWSPTSALPLRRQNDAQ